MIKIESTPSQRTTRVLSARKELLIFLLPGLVISSALAWGLDKHVEKETSIGELARNVESASPPAWLIPADIQVATQTQINTVNSVNLAYREVNESDDSIQ